MRKTIGRCKFPHFAGRQGVFHIVYHDFPAYWETNFYPGRQRLHWTISITLSKVRMGK
jgi:hypothetical protein